MPNKELITELKTKKLFIFDLDGVIWRGNAPIEGAADVITFLQEQNYLVIFMTNNSTKSRVNFREKLVQMGINVPLSTVVNSASATASYIRSKTNYQNIFVIGETGLKEELTSKGLTVVTGEDPSEVDCVVVGMDRHLNYDKLTKALRAIFTGADFIASNPDSTFPTEDGDICPGAGCMIGAVRGATGKDPSLIIGKPNTIMVDQVLNELSLSPSNVVMVGDRLTTDILCGTRSGLYTVLVKTGISEEDETIVPDLVLESVRDFIQ
ncbi:MAG: HAD-IIA family hydrolase [Promethearchaeota archaeon]